MGESKNHMELVQVAFRDIMRNVPEREFACVFVDTPEEGTTPAVLGGFHPDIYFKTANRLIIGEAKTEKDFSRPHSVAQLKAYYLECERFPGSAELVLAVPWTMARRAQNFFRQLRRSADTVSIRVLDERGVAFAV